MKNLITLTTTLICAIVLLIGCEVETGDDAKTRTMTCKIDGSAWSADDMALQSEETTVIITGISENDSLQISFEETTSLISVAKFRSGDDEYSMIFAGTISDLTNNGELASGGFSFTLYDNFFFPNDSIVITEGKFTYYK